MVVKGGSADGRMRDVRLTFGTDQAAVVANWTAVFKDEDCDGHNRQTHDEHHHPDRWTIWFYTDTGHSQTGELHWREERAH